MSDVTNNVLKQLSDLSAAADSIVEENASDFSRLSEWAAIVRNAARNIVESGSSSESTPEIPNLTSFITGKSQRGRRASTVLTEMQKKHIHRKKGRASTKRTSLKSSTKTADTGSSPSSDGKRFETTAPNTYSKGATSKTRRSSKRKSSSEVNLEKVEKVKLFVRLTDIKDGDKQIKNTKIEQKLTSPKPSTKTADTGSSTSSDGKRFETTPPNTYSKGATSKTRRSSKRKSSSEVNLEKVGKAKLFVRLTDIKDRDKQIKNTKIEQLAKISSGDSNTSSLKENPILRSKLEKKQDKAVENRKNILALRQQKLQQNKRARDEKQEVQQTQKTNLEKTKLVKLRSGEGQGRFKFSRTKEATPKANVENETLAITTSSGKYKEKESALKKIMAQTNLKKAGISISKGNEKTPALKNSKNEPEKRTLNTTYVTHMHEPSTSGIKGKTVRDPNIVNDNKTETFKKGVKKTGKALHDEKKDLPSTPTTQKKVPESYAITPSRSSFVSYDISEIRSDSEEEEESSNSKPIPSWALGVHLRNALLQQHHHPIETDELFGNYFEPPDLAAIMGVKKKAYKKRTSSAVWNSSFQ